MKISLTRRSVVALLSTGLYATMLCGQGVPPLSQAHLPGEEQAALLAEYEANPADFQDERLLEVAIAYAEKRRYDKASPVYESFLRTHPTHGKALRGLGNIYYVQGRFDEALRYLREAWAQGDQKALTTLAMSYLRAGRPDDMEYLVPSLLKRKVDDPEIVNCILVYVLDKSDRDGRGVNGSLAVEAIGGLHDQRVLDRDDTAVLIAELVKRLGELDMEHPARSAILKKIVRGYETDPKAWPKARLAAAANAYLFLGLFGNAEVIYRNVLESDPNNVEVMGRLGQALLFQRRFKEAKPYLSRAWEKGDEEALSPLAAAYVGEKDLPAMKDLIPALLKHKAENMEMVNWLTIYALGQKPADRELFFKAIEGFSDDQIARRDDTTTNVVVGLRVFGEKERAERLLKLRKEQAKPKKA